LLEHPATNIPPAIPAARRRIGNFLCNRFTLVSPFDHLKT